ncbi:MAG TPA: hybrid sensor histidine kinase/response regulator [Bacteroidia bacterium]|jgi:signal transduction histidine kinase|nr:hybrid sensor histidine kinase/response regulator [Bacteroidia bacterium]
MNPGKPRILYVDDDPRQLSAFKAAFRRNYEIFIAQSAAEGKEELKKQPIDIIITDQRMPDMTGVEFLESIVKEYPDLIKILMTGYTDLKEAASAINKGKIYCYLNKPWDEVELSMILKNAYDICCTRRELKEKHAELQKTNNELEKFVYSASHDLRAPVLSIKGVINFALSQTKPKDQEYLLMIEKSINRLDVFVENIINYYQNVKLRVSPVEIRFDRMIEETWNSFNFIQNKSEIEFRSQISQEEVFKTDEFRMQVILNNLLLNAIKYQGKDNTTQRISVDIHVANNMATVSVSDTGIGIEPEHLDKIFNMFYRATQEKPGSGLGLYIVREAVDKIDGAIAVKSVVGKGSTFTVTIPGKE